MDTRESNRNSMDNRASSENRSIDAMNRFNQILEDYEDMFGVLPAIPKGGSYSTIADLMEDSLISKQPVKVEDILEAFRDVKCDLV